MQLQTKTMEELRNIINEKSEYRSGPELVSFFNGLGFNDIYQQGFPSRRIYTDEKLKQINGKPELDKCIKNVFAVVSFIEKIEHLDNLISNFNKYLAFDKYAVIRNNDEITFKKIDKIIISDSSINMNDVKEEDFLKREFELNIDSLKLETNVTSIIKVRLKEIEICIKNNASLAAIFLIGSILEGILLGIVTSFPQKYSQSASAPKDKEFRYWNLSNFIDVPSEIGFLKEDVKKFSHVILNFRNYIHPYHQLNSNFNPNKHTALICWQVLQAAIWQISNEQNRKN